MGKSVKLVQLSSFRISWNKCYSSFQICINYHLPNKSTANSDCHKDATRGGLLVDNGLLSVALILGRTNNFSTKGGWVDKDIVSVAGFSFVKVKVLLSVACFSVEDSPLGGLVDENLLSVAIFSVEDSILELVDNVLLSETILFSVEDSSLGGCRCINFLRISASVQTVLSSGIVLPFR